MTNDQSTLGIWEGQLLHFSCAAVLIFSTFLLWEHFSAPYPILFWCSIGIPVVHQIYVWLSWRLELKHKTISKSIGLRGFVAVFFLFFMGRFGSILALAYLDRGSLGFSDTTTIILTIVLAFPGLYALYSVRRYFGLTRAAGADHFEEEYRNMPLVKEGIFRFTKNGMYLYAFLLFWAIAIGFNSIAALIVVAFSHAYIWVHFYATEKPDMLFLYGSRHINVRPNSK